MTPGAELQERSKIIRSLFLPKNNKIARNFWWRLKSKEQRSRGITPNIESPGANCPQATPLTSHANWPWPCPDQQKRIGKNNIFVPLRLSVCTVFKNLYRPTSQSCENGKAIAVFTVLGALGAIECCYFFWFNENNKFWLLISCNCRWIRQLAITLSPSEVKAAFNLVFAHENLLLLKRTDK